MTELLDKVRGGFYGQALGDSWAMPALLTPQQTWDYYGGFIEEYLDAPEIHPVHHGLRRGQVTDDTEQAAAIAESIIREGKVTVQGVADALVGWYHRIGGDASPYVGPSSRRAILAIQRGEDINEVGKFGDTNGAGMRVSPVGLIHPGDVDGAIADAHLSCIPTHNTDIAISGAAAVAGAIAMGLKPGSTLQDVVDAGVYAGEQGRKFGHVWMGASIPARIRLAVEIARKDLPLRQRLQELYDLVGTTLAISEAVPAAFGVLVMAEGHPVRAGVLAAALSGDADTVAAMACAMAGAWSGISAFKPEYLTLMQNANPWLDFEGITAGLYALAAKKVS
jgi:ADP-ribosylglycohydrolase